MPTSSSISKKINFKEIYNISKKTVDEFPNNSNIDFRLEQIVFDKKTKTWNCVISYLVENKFYDPNDRSFGSFNRQLPYERIFKSLVINENNEVESIYMFENGNS